MSVVEVVVVGIAIRLTLVVSAAGAPSLGEVGADLMSLPTPRHR